MSGTSVLTMALALSTLVHTGLATALYYAPLAKSDSSSRTRPRPVELEFEVTSAVRADTASGSIEASTPPVNSRVRRAKRIFIRKRSKAAAAALRLEPAEEQNPLKKSPEDKPVDVSQNPDVFQECATASQTDPIFGRQSANRASGANVMTSGSARSKPLVSVSTKTRAAPSRSQWNSIRSAIERYVEYPRLGRRFGWAGKVILRFKLMTDGRVLEARVDKSSGFALLDRSALKALERASPLPRPETATEITVPILFALK